MNSAAHVRSFTICCTGTTVHTRAVSLGEQYSSNVPFTRARSGFGLNERTCRQTRALINIHIYLLKS